MLTKEFIRSCYRFGGVAGIIIGVGSVLFTYQGVFEMAVFSGIAAIFIAVCSQIIYWYAEDILPRWFSRAPKKGRRDETS